MPRRNRRAPVPVRGRRQEFRRGKPRPCQVCTEDVKIDWKDVSSMRKFTSDRGKIRGRRVSGLCPKHQREAAVAVKNAREMALMPYVSAR